MTKKQAKQIEKILQDADIDVLADDILEIEDIDSLEDWLQDNQALDVEIIYHYSAMEYLMEHDQSLQESMRIASAMGYETKDLNSETLASLLASEDKREEFTSIRGDIEDILI